jgi:hypothetical protein
MKESNHQNYIRNLENPDTYLSRSAIKSWKSPELVREFFESIAEQLNISSHPDWYRISYDQIRNLGGMWLQFIP